MDSPQKQQKSWFSGITSLVGGGRPSVNTTPAKTGMNGGDRNRASPIGDATPSRSRNTFTAPSPDSPDSPPRRASPSMMAQRKIFERSQGPSNKLPANPARMTNFSSVTTPRIFRASVSRDSPAFSFTPRVPPNTLKASFHPETPGRSYRHSAAEVNGRGMSKTTSSDLFKMRIPEPDSKLTGEILAKQVPQDPSRNGSIYASEFLAHLCPPEFNEAQRSQFFCILDLRRLKYAADEIFLKKDWKLNILNFAKEYEKSRSLIMLRYGLYEFKTVKVSKEAVHKWKADHNIPDSDEEEAPLPPKVKVNGTEGILGKRKKNEDLQQPGGSVFNQTAPNKRPRPTPREPLAETTTPALNMGNKRKATVAADDVDETPPAKVRKPAAESSATRTFFEKVANTPAKGKEVPSTAPPEAAAKPSIDPNSLLKPKPGPFAATSKLTEGTLARSVLDGSFKAANPHANIFGYLSDASSAKGSGNEHGDADAEDTDGSEEEESENQEVSQSEPSVVASGGIATPQPVGSLFVPGKPVSALIGSSTSSEASDGASGKSLKDRINLNSKGEPIRMLGQEEAAPPHSGRAPAERVPSPVKAPAPTPTPANRTWNPDTPIKFGPTPTPGTALGAPKATSSVFEAKTSATPGALLGASSVFEPKAAATPSAGLKFGADTAKLPEPSSQAATAPKSSIFTAGANKGSAFDITPKPVSSTARFGQPQGLESKHAEPKLAESTSDAHVPTQTTSSGSVLESKTLFGNASKPDVAKPQASTPLFGAAKQDGEPAKPASSIFPAAAKGGNMFGSGPSATSGEKAPATSIFGASSGQPASTFGAGASKPNGIFAAKPDAPSAKPLFGATPSTSSQDTKPIFGATPSAGQEGKPMFGFSTIGEAPKASSGAFGAATPSTSFGFGGQAAAPAISFGASAPQQPDASQSGGPVIFGSGSGPAPSSGSAGSSFTFNVGGGSEQSFNNPFASGPPSLDFGASSAAPSGQSGATPFLFGAGAATAAPAATGASPMFAFGGAQPPSSAPAPAASGMFGATSNGSSSGSIFNYGGSSTPAASSMFGQQQKQAQPIFNLAPPMGGTSTGTNTPFTLGGASSLATTPAAGTPEPGATHDQAEQGGQHADGDERPQEQIRLTEGGPGEEDEAVVYEVRAKALRLNNGKDGSDSESNASKDKKSPWKTMGVGPLRLLRHKTTGAVRLLLRSEPRGHVALNKLLLPNFNYKPEPGGKYVKVTASNDSGAGLETWMLQVKTKEAAQALAEAMEANKGANKK